MSELLWTGPLGRPHRYQVVASGGGPHHEPGGGVEGLVYRARVEDPGAPDHGDVVALKLLLDCRPDGLAAIDQRLALLTDIHDRRLMRIRGTFVGTALTDEEHPEPDDVDVCYVVSDWIDGVPLTDAARAHDQRWALETVGHIARAVDRLHHTIGPAAPDGVVHRDIKASNVRVRPDGTPVLIDYGLVRAVAADSSVVGTPGWLAPEVAGGQPGGKPADTYGVGAIGHALLLGSPPRRDGSLAAVGRMASALDQVPLPDDIANHLGELLATHPEDRPVHLETWADELDQLLDGTPLAPPTRSGRGPLIAGVAVLAAALIIGVLAVTWSGDDDDDSDLAAEGTSITATTAATTTTSTIPTSTVAGWVCSKEVKLPEGPVADKIRAAYAEHPELCTGTGDPLDEALVLPLLDQAGEPVAAIIASPSTPALYLTTSQVSSYRQIVGRSQDASAPKFGGYPTAVRTDAQTGLGIIDLTLGGMVIGPVEGAQGFWLPQQIRPLWESHGGLHGELGAPMSPVFLTGTMIRLEFERGYLEAPFKDGLGGGAQILPLDVSTLAIHVVDPAAELAALGEIGDRVLRQSSGTAWYVDEDHVRHWIPDGQTWGCLQANDKVIPVDAAGYVVAAVELGDRARCRR